nr:MAG TPA: hypothetical protein [Caudoviricetes sp.]
MTYRLFASGQPCAASSAITKNFETLTFVV